MLRMFSTAMLKVILTLYAPRFRCQRQNSHGCVRSESNVIPVGDCMFSLSHKLNLLSTISRPINIM